MEKYQGYKPLGLNSLLVQIKKNTAIYGTTAIIELIDFCMANNWKGIIWDKLKDNKTALPNKPKVSRFVNYEQRDNWDFKELERLEHEHNMRKLKEEGNV